jgi:hypothetical protein
MATSSTAIGEMDPRQMQAPPPGEIAPKEGPTQPEGGSQDHGENNQDLELHDKELVATLRQLVLDYRVEGLVGRRHEIRRIKKNRLFWQGLHYNTGWDADEQEWQMPSGTTHGLSFGDDEEEEAGPRYEYVTNWYQAYGLSFIAVLSQDVPTVHWYPQDPNNEQDIATAKAASEIAELVLENNHVEELLIKIGLCLWVDGKLGAYVRYVADGQRFGFHQNPIVEPQMQKFGEDAFACPQCQAETPAGQMYGGMICPQCGTQLSQENFQSAPQIPIPVVTGYQRVPNGQEVISIVPGLELNTPVWANELHEMPYVQWQLEVHEAKLRASYPWAAKKIMPGNPNDADDVYARASRVAVQQGLPTTHPGDALYSLITFTRNWIRPWAFYSNKVKEEVRTRLVKLFPDGCYVAFAGDTYCESRNEGVDDHWRVLHAMPGDGQNRAAAGDSIVPAQERYNTLSNLHTECVEYGIPTYWADAQVVDFDALGSKDAQPASWNPAKAKAGQPLANGFFQTQAASLPPDWVEYGKELAGATMQFLSGVVPSIFGGDMPTQETAAGYAVARDQAMGRIGLYWREMKVWWAQVMELSVECFRKNRTSDVQRAVLGDDGEYQTKVISMADLKGNIQARPEVDEKYPRLKSQQRAIVQQLMGFAAEAPEVAEMLNEPANMRNIHDVMGLEDFEIPAEESANKQLREIQELLKSGPTQSMVPGPVGPQPQVSSTVPVNQKLDRHGYEKAEIIRWANSSAGIQAKTQNPMGFANVQAHFDEHDRFDQQNKSQPKPPSESVNFKDLPPGGKAQMAAQAGIQLDPNELAAKEVQDKADKTAEMQARFGQKEKVA